MKIGIAVAFVVCAASMIGCQEQPAAPTQRAAHVTTKPAATKPAATTKQHDSARATTKPAATTKHAATKPVAEKVTADKDGWTLAYTADFSDSKAIANWTTSKGNCAVKDGSLVVSVEEGDAAVLMQKPVFSAPSIRIEVVASLAQAENISDLSILLNASKGAPYDGYTLQFGGKANTMNGLTIKKDSILSTVSNKPLIVPGQKYTIVAENDKGHIKMIVDGKTIIDYVDPSPICGDENGLIGFYTWESKLIIEKLSVFQKGAKK